MTVVGTAYVELQALGNKFGSSLHSSVNAPLTSVGNTAEVQAGRGRRAFGTMFGALVSNSNGALAPLAEVADRIMTVNQDLDHGRRSAGAWALGIGGAATATGAMLTMLGDKEKIAFNQLDAAVTASGHNWSKYSARMEESAKSGTRYGYAANQTADALKQLTISTHSPDEAIKQLSVTMEIAQTRHIGLEQAARMVGRVYGGSTMILRQFGITSNQLQKPVMDLTKAQQQHQAAVMKVQAAEAALQKAQMGTAHTTGDTTSASLRLRAAEQQLATVQQEVSGRTTHTAASQLQLQQAQNSVNTSALSLRSAQQSLAGVQQQVAAGTITGSAATLRLQQAEQRVANATTSHSAATQRLAALQQGTTTTKLTAAQASLKLQQAENAVRLAQEGLSKAQTGSGGAAPSADAVRRAQEKLAVAQQGLKGSTHDLALAQKGSAGQASVADHNLALLSQRIHGQAAAAANTFTGHLKTMGAWIENTASGVGQKLGPALVTAGPLLMGLGAIMETAAGISHHFRTKNLEAAASTDILAGSETAADGPTMSLEGSLAALAGVLERLEPQLGAMPATTAGADAGMAGLAGTADAAAASLAAVGGGADVAAAGEDAIAASGVGMDIALAPILAIGAAVVALAGIVYLAYEHFKPFRDIVNETGHILGEVFMAPVHAAEHIVGWLVHTVEGHGKTLMHDLKTWGPVALAVLAPFIGIPLLIWQHWKTVKHYAEVVWHDVVHVWDDLKHDSEAAWNWIWHNTVGRVENMATDVTHAAEHLWHDVTGVWDSVKHDASAAWGWVWNHTVGLAAKAPGRIWHAIDTGFHDAIHWLENIGGDLIRGLENGISGEAKKLPGQMLNIGKKLIEAPFKSVLGIFSPSAVFSDHGENIVKGLIGGIDKQKLPLSKTLEGIAGLSSDAFSSNWANPFASAKHHGKSYGMQPHHHVVAPTPMKVGPAELLTDINEIKKLVAEMKSEFKSAGVGGTMPVLYVRGNLVLKSKADIDHLSRDLYVTAQNIARAKG